MSGYHLTEIPKGEAGQLSKVLEEVYEAIDAEKQGSGIMVLVELSDVVGAIDLYLRNNFNDFNLNDLVVFSEITARAFESGERS